MQIPLLALDTDQIVPLSNSARIVCEDLDKATSEHFQKGAGAKAY